MVHTFDSYNHFIRLDKGERLVDSIQQFTTEAELSVVGAWVNGLGGVLEVTLGYYDIEKKEYQWETFEGLREITGLQGNIALDQDGKPMVHLHGSFADENYQVIGGHVKDFVAGATVELFIHRTYKPLQRSMNDEIGLQTLDLTNANT